MLVLLLLPAFAEDGLDGHHFAPNPSLGRPLDLLETWQPARAPGSSYGFGALLDYSAGGVVQVTEDWNGTSEEVLLDDVIALNLGGAWSINRRFQLSAGLPLYLASTGPEGAQGLGPGDLRLAAPIGLLPAETGLGLALVPFLDLPTGDETELLGAAGASGGLLVAGGLQQERYTADANLGAKSVPDSGFEAQPGGAALLARLGAGYAFVPRVALRGELVLDQHLAEASTAGVDDPAELLLSLRGRSQGGLHWTLGAGKGISEGVGAPGLRAFAGIGWSHVHDPNVDRDLDGIVDASDACPEQAEVKNGWKDEEGCPDALASWQLLVVDDEGTPLAATWKSGDQEQRLEANGQLSRKELMPGTVVEGSLSAPDHVTALIKAELAEGENSRKVELPWVAGTTRIIVKDEAGAPLNARVIFKGPSELPPVELGEDGVHQLVLPPGDWQLVVGAEGKGSELKNLSVSKDRPGLQKVEVVLRKPMVVLKRAEVMILEQINFDLDSATLRSDAEPILRQVAAVLAEHPELVKIEVQGHTDNEGPDIYNLDLSQRRVEAVVSWLVAKGIPAERLVAKGYGESQPLTTNATEAGRARNRRVQFVVAERKEEADPTAPKLESAPKAPPKLETAPKK